MSEYWHRKREDLEIWISWHLPARLIAWCAIRMMTFRYGGAPGDRTCEEALRAWYKAHRIGRQEA
jgi:hypothetical protein